MKITCTVKPDAAAISVRRRFRAKTAAASPLIGLSLLTVLPMPGVAQVADPEAIGASQYYATPGASVIGGGDGYNEYCKPNQPVITDLKGLKRVPSGGSPKDVFYVADDAVIDLTCEWPITIPAGVTLCSGRGRDGSAGGLLVKTVKPKGTPSCAMSGNTIMLEMREGAVVTGLRFDGRDPETKDHMKSTYDEPWISGIRINDAKATAKNPVVVSNSEFTGFSHYGVSTNETLGDGSGEWSVIVRNSYFHHNRRDGLGYGVQVDGDSRMIIEANYFDFNRHDIAGSGDPGQAYIARYNLVGNGGTSHNFDMHREGGSTSPKPNAGDYVEIHDNTFSLTKFANVRIAGIPDNGAYVRRNVFPRRLDKALYQEVKGKLYESDNTTDAAAWFVSESGKSGWRLINASKILKARLAFGDFVGDDKIDAFTSDGARWYVSESGRGPWKVINYSRVSFSLLRFADLTGDARTDVFKKEGRTWSVSEGGSGRWQALRSSDAPLEQLLFGDLVGDRKDDVVQVSGSRWYAYDRGKGEREAIGCPEAKAADVFLIDMIGDGRDDIVWPTGSHWQACDRATGKWQRINVSVATRRRLNAGDVVGDAKTDFVVSEDGTWKVSESGSSPWRYLNSSGYDIAGQQLLDLVGDRKDDVLLIVER